MYCEYKYNAGQTAADLLSDLVGVLTGTITDKANFSAGVNQTTTNIYLDYDPAGWEVWDADSGTNTTVIRAPCDGDPTQFKYIRLNTNTVGYILMEFYEFWNNVAHTGTNLATNSNAANLSWNTYWSASLSGEIFISASNRRLMLFSRYDTVPTIYMSYVLESDRVYTWCGVGQGFIPAIRGGVQSYTATRHITGNGSISNSTNSTGLCLHAKGGHYNSVNRVRMANGTSAITLLSLYTPDNLQPQFHSFDISDVYGLGHIGLFSLFDEFIYNGETRVILPNIGNAAAVVSTVYPVVPKG